MPKHGSKKQRRSVSRSASASSRRKKKSRSVSRSVSTASRRKTRSRSRKARRGRGSSKSAERDARKRKSRSNSKAEKDKAKEKEKGKEREKERDASKSRKGTDTKSRRKSPEARVRSGAETKRSRSRKRSHSRKSRSRKRRSPEAKSKGGKIGSEPPEAAKADKVGGLKGLGDLAQLQKRLEEDRGKLQLFVLKAKQEQEEELETADRKERRDREYYRASYGEPIGPGNRFLVEGDIGKGAFSTVYKCRDVLAQGKEFAVKFIRANPMLRKATEKEVKLMRRLRSQASEKDPEGASCLLGLAGPESFDHNGHLVLVFHLQRCDLRTGLHKYGQGNGLPLLPTVQNYAKNIFLALRALRKIDVVHSDLKPDNLLMSLDKLSVKLSDFGSAMEKGERLRTDEVQPRYYRSPEVMLGQAYDMQIDIWSAGVTLFELATSRHLFTGKTNNGMLHEMLKTCGPFAAPFASTGESAAKHFSADGGAFRPCDQSLNGSNAPIPMSKFPKMPWPLVKPLLAAVKQPSHGPDASHHQAMLRTFADLVTKCVVPDPAERFTPEQALDHAFFKKPT